MKPGLLIAVLLSIFSADYLFADSKKTPLISWQLLVGKSQVGERFRSEQMRNSKPESVRLAESANAKTYVTRLNFEKQIDGPRPFWGLEAYYQNIKGSGAAYEVTRQNEELRLENFVAGKAISQTGIFALASIFGGRFYLSQLFSLSFALGMHLYASSSEFQASQNTNDLEGVNSFGVRLSLHKGFDFKIFEGLAFSTEGQLFFGGGDDLGMPEPRDNYTNYGYSLLFGVRFSITD